MRPDITTVKVGEKPARQQVDDDEAQWIADDCERERRSGNLRGFTDLFDELGRNKSQAHAPVDPDDPDGDELNGEALEIVRATACAIATGVVSALRDHGVRDWHVKHVVRDRWILAFRFRDGRIQSIDLEDLRDLNDDPDGKLGRQVVDSVCGFLVKKAA